MGKGDSGPKQYKPRGLRYWWLTALVGLVIVGAAIEWRAQGPPPQLASTGPALSSETVVSALTRRETRPTLDPALFVGKAARTHQVAREIPDILDQLYCYCECDKHVGHKSLLSCYTDGHAAT